VQAQNPFQQGQNKLDGLEKLLNECYYNHDQGAETKNQDPPSIIFQAAIKRSATLKDLVKLQRTVQRHFGVKLIYRFIEFDSSGLSSISIEAKLSSGISKVYNFKLTDSRDYEKFAIVLQGQRKWIIASKTDWQESFQVLLTCR
jgi:hypothetical protein